MKEKVLYVDVELKERIWGGDFIPKYYNQESLEPIGEAWVLSGHQNGQSVILNGEHKGIKLNDLYLNERSLFGDSNHDRFPLLIKVLDAVDNLSVQVHPTDEYGLKHHGDLGKNECWYILDAKEDSSIIFGQTAKNRDEFKKMVDDKKWDELLTKVPVKKGEFYNIPAGTVHAIGHGIQILEVQQSSDTTYRIYDYDRVGADGKTRELHIERSLDVIDYDLEPVKQDFETNGPITRFVTNQYFTVDKIESRDDILVSQENTYSIIYSDGGDTNVTVDNEEHILKNGYTLIVTANVNEFKLSGNANKFVIRENFHDLNKSYKY